METEKLMSSLHLEPTYSATVKSSQASSVKTQKTITILMDENTSGDTDPEKAFFKEGFADIYKCLDKGPQIGAGSYGQVYKLIHNSDTEVKFVVKEIFLGSSKRLKSFEREYSILTKLPMHNRIIPFYGYTINKPRCSLYFGFMKEGTLSKHFQNSTTQDSQNTASNDSAIQCSKNLALKDNIVQDLQCLQMEDPFLYVSRNPTLSQNLALKEQKCFFFIQQILEGLEFLHNQEIIHRDIKGENVLLEDLRNARIADFGQAKLLSGETNSIEEGTYRWMAPEVLRKDICQGNYTTKADIWSVGCTAIEIFTGDVPYSHVKGPQAVIGEIYTGNRPSFPEGITKNFKQFLTDTINPNYLERKTATDLLQEYFPCVTTANSKIQGNILAQELNSVSEGDYLGQEKCHKQSNHKLFISVSKLTELHDLETCSAFQLIEWVIPLTVKIDVKATSQQRPQCWPNSDTPYPFYAKNNDTNVRFGTGMVYDVTVFKENKNKCPCSKCMNSQTPSKVWGVVEIMTANHVVFDQFEARETSCRFFYDTEDSELIALNNFSIAASNVVKNWCRIECITCDEKLLDKLETCLKKFEQLREDLSQPLDDDTREEKMGFIVSHPHGGPKQISMGKLIDTEIYDSNWCQFKYTMPTCPGSSGAYVHIVGETSNVWHYPHVHSGCINNDVNYSSIGFRANNMPPTASYDLRDAPLENRNVLENEDPLDSENLMNWTEEDNSFSKEIPVTWTKGEKIGTEGSFYTLVDDKKPYDKSFVLREVTLSTEKRISNKTMLKHMNECNLLQNLNHERLIQYYGVLKQDNKMITFFKLMALGSLEEYYNQNGPIAEARVFKYAEQILEGLVYLHEGNIAHMNIRGKTIFLESEEKIRISGFQFGHKGSQPFHSVHYGHERWSAPEIFNPALGEGKCNAKCDIWSLGCTLIEMLTADVPYEYVKFTLAVIGKLIEGERPIARTITSQKLETFLRNILCAQAMRRKTSFQILQELRDDENWRSTKVTEALTSKQMYDKEHTPVSTTIGKKETTTHEMSCLVDECETLEIVNLKEVQELIKDLRLLNWKAKDISSLVRNLIRQFECKVDWTKYCENLISNSVRIKIIILCEDEKFTLLLRCIQYETCERNDCYGESEVCFTVLSGKVMFMRDGAILEKGAIRNSLDTRSKVSFKYYGYDTPAVILELYFPPLIHISEYGGTQILRI